MKQRLRKCAGCDKLLPSRSFNRPSDKLCHTCSYARLCQLILDRKPSENRSKSGA